MKKEYIKPEIKEVLTNCEELLTDFPISGRETGEQWSKGNSSFEGEDPDWDE